jgi:hypothetical protein
MRKWEEKKKALERKKYENVVCEWKIEEANLASVSCLVFLVSFGWSGREFLWSNHEVVGKAMCTRACLYFLR